MKRHHRLWPSEVRLVKYGADSWETIWQPLHVPQHTKNTDLITRNMKVYKHSAMTTCNCSMHDAIYNCMLRGGHTAQKSSWLCKNHIWNQKVLELAARLTTHKSGWSYTCICTLYLPGNCKMAPPSKVTIDKVDTNLVPGPLPVFQSYTQEKNRQLFFFSMWHW